MSTKECKPASEILSRKEAGEMADVVERITTVERIITEDYCLSKGRCSFFPVGSRDFLDLREGFSTVTKFLAYLKANNPHIDEKLLATQVRMPLPEGEQRTRRIPDLISHEPPDRFEYYEMKPNSSHGVADGRNKVMFLIPGCVPSLVDIRVVPRWSACSRGMPTGVRQLRPQRSLQQAPLPPAFHPPGAKSSDRLVSREEATYG
jgi:hypothetical protein